MLGQFFYFLICQSEIRQDTTNENFSQLICKVVQVEGLYCLWALLRKEMRVIVSCLNDCFQVRFLIDLLDIGKVQKYCL